jgi:hypothetical protein
MTEQFKSMTPEDIREQKMRDKMGAAADKARENSLGTGKEPGTMEMLGNLGRKIKDSVMGTDKPAPAKKKESESKPAPVPAKKPLRYAPSEENAKFNDDYKKGGCVKMAKGGTASSRADGCAIKGKTRGKIC